MKDLRQVVNDWMHDTFPHRRTWDAHHGWRFNFGGVQVTPPQPDKEKKDVASGDNPDRCDNVRDNE